VGNTQEPSGIQTLLARRGEEYGMAWKITGEMAKHVNLHEVTAAGYLYPWITMLCKLVRATVSPRNPDHWRDIAGYATLVLNDLAEGGTGADPDHSPFTIHPTLHS
jgi:hypothetical protein